MARKGKGRKKSAGKPWAIAIVAVVAILAIYLAAPYILPQQQVAPTSEQQGGGQQQVIVQQPSYAKPMKIVLRDVEGNPISSAYIYLFDPSAQGTEDVPATPLDSGQTGDDGTLLFSYPVKAGESYIAVICIGGTIGSATEYYQVEVQPGTETENYFYTPVTITRMPASLDIYLVDESDNKVSDGSTVTLSSGDNNYVLVLKNTDKFSEIVNIDPFIYNGRSLKFGVLIEVSLAQGSHIPVIEGASWSVLYAASDTHKYYWMAIDPSALKLGSEDYVKHEVPIVIDSDQMVGGSTPDQATLAFKAVAYLDTSYFTDEAGSMNTESEVLGTYTITVSMPSS